MRCKNEPFEWSKTCVIRFAFAAEPESPEPSQLHVLMVPFLFFALGATVKYSAFRKEVHGRDAFSAPLA